MSLSFKTVAKVTTPATGNLRAATDETGTIYFKFIGDKALSLEEVTTLLRDASVDAVAPTAVTTKRSGYKYKTTWSV